MVINHRSISDDLHDLRVRLRDCAADLATHLLGHPNRLMSSKRQLRFGNKGSLSVEISGAKAGLWYDHESGEGGDLFSLIMREQGCGFIDAKKFAQDFGGPALSRPRPKPSLQVVGGRDHDSSAQKNERRATTIFHNADGLDHSIAKRYFERRGLICPSYIDERVLRFSPKCPFGNNERHPALIALFTGIEDNEPRAILRIALTSDGEKINRKMLGPVGGAAIKLSPDVEVSTRLHIGEGLETCIAAMLAGFRPTWAVGSAGAIAAFPVRTGIKALSILGEVNDGSANARAAQACAIRWQEADADIFVIEPLIGGDLNDVWREVHL
jgi:putative DNA primase/helicase